MNKFHKKQMYDSISKLLTEYEDAKSGEDIHANFEMDLYSMLVTIQNTWEELTGETQ